MNRILLHINAMLFKNKMILHYPQSCIKKNRVNLHAYHPEWEFDTASDMQNLGDYLSSVVVSFMLDKKGYSLSAVVPSTRHLYAIGSILLMGYQNACIWGTGFPFEPSSIRGGAQIPI